MKPSTGAAVRLHRNAVRDRPESLAAFTGIRTLLAQYGITVAQLQAKAAQLEGGDLQMFDRMVAARENGRRLLRKEAERRTPRQGHDPDETTEQ